MNKKIETMSLYELDKKKDYHQNLFISSKSRVWEINQELTRRENPNRPSLVWSTLPKKLFLMDDSELIKELKKTLTRKEKHHKKYLEFKEKQRMAFEKDK